MLQSPGFSLSIQLACISHHPNFNLPLLLYPHHVCFDQQLVNRTICCQWVIRNLEEERTWIWKSSLKTTSTPTQKSVLLATISSLSYPKKCHQSKDFGSHTRVCDEAKVNINLVHLHMGGQISSWPTFAHALCHVIGSLNINPTACPKNVLAVVVPATLAVKACPSAGTHIPSPHGGIERSQLFTDGKTWKPEGGEVEDCTIVGRRSLNAQLSKNIQFTNSCLTLNGKTSLRGNRILKGTQRCWRTLPHNIPRSVLAVMKKGIFEGPSTNVWPNHLRWFWSFFDTKINGLRVSMLHPICILVKIGRVIWVRQVLDSEGYVLRKVLCIFAVPFCKSIIKDR